MENKRIYIYPDRSYSFNKDSNPYRSELAGAFVEAGATVIASKTAWLGTLDFFLHLHKLDILVLNWIEEVANRRFGYIQTLGFILVLPLLKLFNIKLVWTIHNKVGHSKKNTSIANFVRSIMFKTADNIITHAQEGKDYFQNMSAEVNFYPHPFKKKALATSQPHFKYDILIWGKIQPYKGILEFLTHLYDSGLEERFNIIIQGDCPNLDYFEQLNQYESKNVEIINGFISDDRLKELMSQSRCVLFAHKNESVLSSGALVDSLSFYKTIVGPHIGNFKDFQSESLIYTYHNNQEMIEILVGLLNGKTKMIDPKLIEAYIDKFSWLAYARYLLFSVEQFDNSEVKNKFDGR